MANDPSPPAKGGLSLYANLLNPKSSTPGSISSAPVSYKQQENAEQDEAAKQQQSLAGT
jgi:splicing factor 45